MMAPMPPPSSALDDAPAPPLRVPVRFQCPLCFDVLRRPILLPCCRRHLCMECFERALELTSVNCGFCRRRVVGFARTKRYKVDEGLWRAIRAQCPFLTDAADGMEDLSPSIEFVDEDAPPLHSQGEDHPTTAPSHDDKRTPSNEARPGEIKAFYEQQLRAHHTRQREAEQRALQQTMAFLEADPEYQASSTSQVKSGSSSTTAPMFRPILTASANTSGTTVSRRRYVAGSSALRSRGGRSEPGHRPLTRSKSHSDSKQQRLDLFLTPSTIVTRSMTPDPASDADIADPAAPSLSDEEEHPHKQRRRREEEEEAVVIASPPRTRSQTQIHENETMLITRHNHYPRSSSHSPKRHAPYASKPLFQTTLVAQSHSSGHDNADGEDPHVRTTRRANSADGAPAHLVVSTTPAKNVRKKILTRQGSRRAWKCPQCTFENTCFDSRCSMCHSVPPASAYTPL